MKFSEHTAFRFNPHNTGSITYSRRNPCTDCPWRTDKAPYIPPTLIQEMLNAMPTKEITCHYYRDVACGGAQVFKYWQGCLELENLVDKDSPVFHSAGALLRHHIDGVLNDIRAILS